MCSNEFVAPCSTEQYHAVPILQLPSCQDITFGHQLQLQQTCHDAWDRLQQQERVGLLWNFDSDGAGQRRQALALFCSTQLLPSSPLFPYVAQMYLLDTSVGPGDTTAAQLLCCAVRAERGKPLRIGVQVLSRSIHQAGVDSPTWEEALGMLGKWCKAGSAGS